MTKGDKLIRCLHIFIIVTNIILLLDNPEMTRLSLIFGWCSAYFYHSMEMQLKKKKPLVWVNTGSSAYSDVSDCRYYVNQDSWKMLPFDRKEKVYHCTSIEDGKKSAQEYHNNRI